MRLLLRATCGLALVCALGLLRAAHSVKLPLDPLADDSHAIATAVAEALRAAEGAGEREQEAPHPLRRTLQGFMTQQQQKKKKKKAKAAQAGSVDVKAVTDGKPKQPNCAWQAYVTGSNINAAYPDTHCVYQVLVMLGTTKDKIFRIKGRFPTKGNRYFSLQSNNPEIGFPLATIRDFEVKPDPGSGKNPYAEEAAPNEVGTYTIYVTPFGDQGLPNEIPLCTEDMSTSQCRSVTAIMIFRYYTSDPDSPGPLNSETDQPGGHEPRLFGYAPAPKVEVRTKMATPWKPEVWEEFKPCDQSRPTPITKHIESNFAKVIPGWDAPRYADADDNFVLYLGQDSSSNGVYPNLDANYLVANMIVPADAPAGEVRIAKVTGALPLTAASFTRDPKIPNWEDYEIRYNSFSTINKVPTAPTLQSLDDSAIIRKYGGRPGWAANRTYSIVVAPHKALTCGLLDEAEDLFLSTTAADGTVANHFAILDRQLVPKFTRDGRPDRSITHARVACGQMGDNLACLKPDVLRGLLGDYYPSVTWYTCKDGVLTRAYAQTLTEKYFSS